MQDYTHEREWRCPVDIPMNDVAAFIVPTPAFALQVNATIPVLPLTLFMSLDSSVRNPLAGGDVPLDTPSPFEHHGPRLHPTREEAEG